MWLLMAPLATVSQRFVAAIFIEDVANVRFSREVGLILSRLKPIGKRTNDITPFVVCVVRFHGDGLLRGVAHLPVQPLTFCPSPTGSSQRAAPAIHIAARMLMFPTGLLSDL